MLVFICDSFSCSQANCSCELDNRCAENQVNFSDNISDSEKTGRTKNHTNPNDRSQSTDIAKKNMILQQVDANPSLSKS